jgi:hypothetical protein
VSTRERAWAAHTEIMAIGMDAPHRAVQRFGPIVCADLGVPHAWGVQSSSGLIDPSVDDAHAALEWLRARGAAHGWQATTPEAMTASPHWQGLHVVDRRPVFAMDTHAVSHLEVELPPGLTLTMHPSYDLVVEGYGG